jgi:hypothetical protein
MALPANASKVTLGRFIRRPSSSIARPTSSNPPSVEPPTLRCGKQIKLVVGEVETDRPVINQQLMALILDARRWFTDLRTGRCTTIAKIASREGLQVSEVSRSISLAFLALYIVEMILSGRQPITLTLERLRACRPLPLDWSEQCDLLLA